MKNILIYIGATFLPVYSFGSTNSNSDFSNKNYEKIDNIVIELCTDSNHLYDQNHKLFNKFKRTLIKLLPQMEESSARYNKLKRYQSYIDSIEMGLWHFGAEHSFSNFIIRDVELEKSEPNYKQVLLDLEEQLLNNCCVKQKIYNAISKIWVKTNLYIFFPDTGGELSKLCAKWWEIKKELLSLNSDENLTPWAIFCRNCWINQQNLSPTSAG